MPDVTRSAVTELQLERAGKIWRALTRPEAEGLLVMTRWFPHTAAGAETLANAALWQWHDMGHELQKEIARTVASLTVAFRV